MPNDFLRNADRDAPRPRTDGVGMSTVRGTQGLVPPPPPADAPSARELISESALVTPFRLHGMPMTRVDATTCRTLAAKLNEGEVRWVMLIMLEFFRHGQRDFMRSQGIEQLPEGGGRPA